MRPEWGHSHGAGFSLQCVAEEVMQNETEMKPNQTKIKWEAVSGTLSGKTISRETESIHSYHIVHYTQFH